MADGYADDLRAFRQGFKESDYIEGENVAIDYRWGENQPDRLPAMAADLVRCQVNVIAAASAPASVAAAKATARTPIVFLVPEDPVRLGLVTSLSRPGGNATGINFFAAELGPEPPLNTEQKGIGNRRGNDAQIRRSATKRVAALSR